MEATERQVRMGTQTDGPVKQAHAPRCSHPHRLWGGSTVTCVCYPVKVGFCATSIKLFPVLGLADVQKPLGLYEFH